MQLCVKQMQCLVLGTNFREMRTKNEANPKRKIEVKENRKNKVFMNFNSFFERKIFDQNIRQNIITQKLPY